MEQKGEPYQHTKGTYRFLSTGYKVFILQDDSFQLCWCESRSSSQVGHCKKTIVKKVQVEVRKERGERAKNKRVSQGVEAIGSSILKVNQIKDPLREEWSNTVERRVYYLFYKTEWGA